MDKQELYQQIKDFNKTLTNRSDRSSKSYEKAYLYVDDKNAEDKAEFISYLIENKYLENEYSHVLDLTFGSANLTSHIIFDNDISYETITLNDINIEKSNLDIDAYIDNCTITDNDILDSSMFEDSEADLIIVNPQIGGNYTDGDILNQKEEDDKTQREVLDKLQTTLNLFIDDGKTVLFYGKDKDFESLFSTKKYIRYMSTLQQLYIVDSAIEEKLCFEKVEDEFVINDDCKNIKKNDEAPESFDEIILDVDDFLSDKIEAKKEEIPMKEEKNKIDNNPLGNIDFSHKNILLKGVPGTGKSKTIDNIIENNLEMKELQDNVLRINIHSASSNSDLMQGISITTDDKSNILYAEKKGAVLNHIFEAMYKPNQPFVLVLEEIQENSLNELIGDLIYLIEKDKRTVIELEDEQWLSYKKLYKQLEEKFKENSETLHHVELPNLVENSDSNTKMIMPDNLYVFCTSNYRDDRKVIEDNLLRRFDVVEIYPKYFDESWVDSDGELIFKSKDISDFLEKLNGEILKQFKNETHPDRYLVGHANWLSIEENDKELFYTALLKVIIEFKEIREVDFNSYVKPILKKLFKKDDGLSDRVEDYLKDFYDYDKNELKLNSYKLLVEKLQKKIYSDFL